MRIQFLHLLVLQLLLLTILSAWSGEAGSSTRMRGKKKMAKARKEMNICDIQDQGVPIYCYCNNGGMNSTEADCWVMSKFVLNESMSRSFESQHCLKKLTFTVRQIGSLDHVPTQLLHKMNLRTIVFQYAKFRELGEYTFSNFTSVSEINLSRNMIEVLRKYAFENMRNLTLINLDNNRICEINR